MLIAEGIILIHSVDLLDPILEEVRAAEEAAELQIQKQIRRVSSRTAEGYLQSYGAVSGV